MIHNQRYFACSVGHRFDGIQGSLILAAFSFYARCNYYSRRAGQPLSLPQDAEGRGGGSTTPAIQVFHFFILDLDLP